VLEVARKDRSTVDCVVASRPRPLWQFLLDSSSVTNATVGVLCCGRKNFLFGLWPASMSNDLFFHYNVHRTSKLLGGSCLDVIGNCVSLKHVQTYSIPSYLCASKTRQRCDEINVANGPTNEGLLP
jgi:hypothetical protein